MAAEDLLSQARAAQLANDPALMQPLALACHARMLELATTDPHQAAHHALAGAQLFGALVARGGNQPDWLAIHEEQCCRYGGIGIHDLLQAGDPPQGISAADALRLLARMEELHPEPVDWVPVLRASLLHHQDAPAPAAAAKPARQPTLAALINYFDDAEMLGWQLRSGCLDPYDRIYIWDGPYQYSGQLALGAAKPTFLADSPLGQKLLADPRVVYRQGQWLDEGEKRIEAFAAIEEDLIILHDSDEFFFLDRGELERFWHSGHDIAEHLTQNLYAGGLLASDVHHRSASAATLPCKRIIFRNKKISPAQHLDYLWLVGVKQNHGDDSKICPAPLGHTFHLTGCRSTNGQIGKMSFYKSLALSSQQSTDPVLHRLRLLIEAGSLSAEEAVLLFLRGDPGFAGIPHPDSGFSLQPSFPDPRFPAGLLQSILADSHQVNTGPFQVLEGYPLVLWFPATTVPRPLCFALAEPGRLRLRSWLWLNRQPALASPPIAATTAALHCTLPAATDLMGTLVEIQIEPPSPSPRCQVLQVSPC
jgi:hypothetical protein